MIILICVFKRINNMENKEQNTMSLEEAAVDYIAQYPARAREYGLVYNAIKFGASWQSSQPINSGWVLCDDDMPELNEAVWISNGCGWTALGCLVECEGGYCWAVTNGIIYEEDGKIVSECELDDDYDVVYWHRLPTPPKQ